MSSMNKSTIKKIVGIVVVVGIAAILLGPLLFGAKTTTIDGAGSSFINPLMSQWIDDYKGVNDQVNINYASVGSGSGIGLLKNNTVNFGASDAPLGATDYSAFGNPVHIPMTVGGIVIAYNIPGISQNLNLTGDIIAKVFLGTITKWNNPEIQAANPGVTLPDQTIFVAHRSDGSGTTYGFSDYLSHVSANWKASSHGGTGKTIDWAVGSGGKGNEGVTSLITTNDYSIGYIELAYAKLKDVTYANLQSNYGTENNVSDYVTASIDSIQQSMNNAAGSLPAGTDSWAAVTMVNAPGQGSYPIVSFTYVIVYQDLHNLDSMTQAQALYDFLWYGVHDGQAAAKPLWYVPLAQGVVKIDVTSLNGLTFNGAALTYNTA